MSKNVGGADQAIRLIFGAALLALGFLHVVSGSLAIAAYVFGIVALASGFFRYCPAWTIFGINTHRVAHK